MKTSVVLQPSNAEMGEIIKNLLSSQNPVYDKVWLVSAFANARAIQRIAPNILEAKARGANINIVVGFDVNSTSAEALKRITRFEPVDQPFLPNCQVASPKFTCLKQ
jgi:HKD family nuclease